LDPSWSSSEAAVLRRTTSGPGQERRDPPGGRDRPRAGAAAPCGWVKDCAGEVQMSEAHVAGAREAHHGVEGWRRVVHRGPHLVHDRRDLLDVRVEQAERVRLVSIRHDVGAAFAARSSRPRPRPRRASLTTRPASSPYAGLVPCAVSGVSTFVRRSPRSSCRARVSSTSGELAMGAGRGLQAHVGQPGDLRALLQRHISSSAPCAPRGLQRMQARCPGSGRDALVQRGLCFIVQERGGRRPSPGRSCAWRGARSGHELGL